MGEKRTYLVKREEFRVQELLRKCLDSRTTQLVGQERR